MYPNCEVSVNNINIVVGFQGTLPDQQFCKHHGTHVGKTWNDGNSCNMALVMEAGGMMERSGERLSVA